MFKGTQQFGTQNYELEKPLLDQIEQQFEVYRKTTDEAERKAIYHVIDSLSYEASKLAIPNEYDKLMAAIGANGTNAYTSFDVTCYIEDIPSNQVENWAKVLEEYAIRYGDGVKGWWIDGCYKRTGYDDEELVQLYADAIKKGNPNAIISFNNGTPTALEKCFALDDYVAGERNDFDMIPTSRFIDGAQSYILAPLGVLPGGEPYEMWGRPGLKHEGWWMRDYVKLVNTNGGVVSIDIVLNRDGSFDPEQIQALKYINR
jgi:hypothetical protein